MCLRLDRAEQPGNSLTGLVTDEHLERFPFIQNFWFEIPDIFLVKRKGFLHAGEKLTISLVDDDGSRSWCMFMLLTLIQKKLFSNKNATLKITPVQ